MQQVALSCFVALAIPVWPPGPPPLQCDSLQAPFRTMLDACAHMLRQTLHADLMSKEVGASNCYICATGGRPVRALRVRHMYHITLVPLGVIYWDGPRRYTLHAIQGTRWTAYPCFCHTALAAVYPSGPTKHTVTDTGSAIPLPTHPGMPLLSAPRPSSTRWPSCSRRWS